MSDLIEREDAIMALRLEYPMMPLFKSLREEWAIKTEGFRKAEEVIMKLPSADVVSLEEFEQMRFLADKSMETVGEPTWTDALAELHERFDALEKEIRKASAEMSAAIREYVDRPKGEWILECDAEGEDDNLYRCSECGCNYGCQEYDIPNFCPNCGADMREREGE